MGRFTAAIKEKAANQVARVEKFKPEEGKEFTEYLEDEVKQLFEELATACLKKPLDVMSFITKIALDRDELEELDRVDRALKYVETE